MFIIFLSGSLGVQSTYSICKTCGTLMMDFESGEMHSEICLSPEIIHFLILPCGLHVEKKLLLCEFCGNFFDSWFQKCQNC